MEQELSTIQELPKFSLILVRFVELKMFCFLFFFFLLWCCLFLDVQDGAHEFLPYLSKVCGAQNIVFLLISVLRYTALHYRFCNCKLFYATTALLLCFLWGMGE